MKFANNQIAQNTERQSQLPMLNLKDQLRLREQESKQDKITNDEDQKQLLHQRDDNSLTPKAFSIQKSKSLNNTPKVNH